MDRRDDRLGRVLDRRRARRAGWGGCGGLPNSRDVGAGDEGAPGADQHDRLDARVRVRRLDALLDALPHARRQRVDRRRIEGDRRDFAVDRDSGHGVDGGHRFPPECGDVAVDFIFPRAPPPVFPAAYRPTTGGDIIGLAGNAKFGTLGPGGSSTAGRPVLPRPPVSPIAAGGSPGIALPGGAPGRALDIRRGVGPLSLWSGQ